ncbi:XrtA/PEP-CTERM system TPR-repeat protein PrsT [Alteromonas sp. C1M14]|uniref:XrtA/PEP-CTERM system TPR-repeat protein PrsT n=1 Tax=Alteromonas sp. C1M14 TaxID=2841567 RepID=UPI001C09A8E9|nr:XrtA/PEP-CTERM system TPR-repeat protein PrsT [Alteromonas sp. C1M14]MBU2979043.1 PEP-CTERM system TPR-repeat protein PrsT [Alteromonas sp. C1M14]
MNNLRIKTFFIPVLFFALLVYISSLSAAAASTFEDYEKALDAYNKKDYQTAFVHLKNSLQQDPNNLTAKILMGRLLLQNGYVRAAELEFKESMEMGADLNLVAGSLGTSWLFMNRYHDIVNFTDYKRLGSQQKSAWLQIRATACTKLGNEACAKKAYEQMLTLPFDRDDAYTGLAAIAMRKDDLKTAADLLAKSKAINQDNAILWRLTAQLSFRNGDVNTAIENFKHALSLNSDDPIALRNLVNIYIARDDYASARQYVDEIMARTPDDPLAILLNNWLMTQEDTVTTNTAEIQKLGNTLSELSPDVVESQPLLIYISALTAYFNGNIEKAVGDFERYLAKNPDDLQGIKLLAKAYISTQRPKLALSLLEQKQSVLMQDLNAALLLGDLLIEQNKSFRANSLIRTLEARYPDSLQLQLFKIKLMTVRGQEKQALALLDANYEAQQLNPTFLFTYASMKMRFRDFEDAHKAVDGLIKIFPQKSDVYNLKASLFIQQEEFDKARTTLNKALSLNQESFAARFNLASLDAKTGNIAASTQRLDALLAQVPRHVPSQLLKAQNLIIVGSIGDAEKMYKNVLALNPNNQEARVKLVQISAKRGNLDDALYQLDKLLKKDFDNPTYVLQKADILISLERYQDAEKSLVLIEEMIQDKPKMLERYGNILIKLRRPDEALVSFSKARELAPYDNELALHTAKLQIALGKVTQAASTIASRIDSNQDNPNFWYVAGLLAEKKANYTKAAQAYSRALTLSANFAQPLLAAYKMASRGNNPNGFIAIARGLMKRQPEYLLPANLLAQHFYYSGEFDKAIPIYVQLASLPQVLNKSKVLNRLAEMSAQTDTLQASKWIAQAYKLKNSDPEILDTYGWVLAHEGKYQESLEMLRRSFSRQATNPKLRYHLGYTLAKMGRDIEAREHLEIAVYSDEDFIGKAQAEKMLNSL